MEPFSCTEKGFCSGREKMPLIDSTNAKEHSYAVYGRQFKSYRCFKPVIVGVLFVIFYIIFAAILSVTVVFTASHGAPGSFRDMLSTIFADGQFVNGDISAIVYNFNRVILIVDCYRYVSGYVNAGYNSYDFITVIDVID